MSAFEVASTVQPGAHPSPAGAVPAGKALAGEKPLDEKEKREVADLKRRDREVKAHEAAHVAAGGQYVRGAPAYQYKKGPDGRQYAVAGEVSIDTSPVSGNPEATLAKMQIVKRAALAPAQPSGQDRSVAAQATATESKARREIMEKRGAESVGAGGAGSPASKNGAGGQPLFAKAANAYAGNSIFARRNSAVEVPSAIDIAA